jgi:hypothetical protein
VAFDAAGGADKKDGGKAKRAREAKAKKAAAADAAGSRPARAEAEVEAERARLVQEVERLEAQLQLFRQWQEPYINACDKLDELIERPEAVRLLKPRRERKRLRQLTGLMQKQAQGVPEWTLGD